MQLSELVQSLLIKRGVSGAEAFLNPDYAAHAHDPFLFPDMDRAADRILEAMAQHERIAVYADFDCDGIPGGALFSDLFEKLGYDAFEVYVPHRDREGYGFHAEAIDVLASRGVSLIITVDVGTTAVRPVAHAKEKGIDVIVTDHHELPHALPAAYALLNPKRAPYPFPDLCGAAVAFKLAAALLIEGRRRGLAQFLAVPEGWEKWLLDLVAIATVADMVPLVGENRVLAYWGLRVLRKSPRPGIGALCTKLRIRKSELTEDDIGFLLAPRINAASRMDDPELALRLLTTRDVGEAQALAAQLESLNSKRKTHVGGIVREAKKRMRERYEDERVVVLGNPEWKPALLGLAANSLMEERGGLVCLWGRDALGRIKGSCRSDGALSVVEVFSGAGDALEESGGHAASGGFSVSHERIHDLPETLNAVASALQAAPLERSSLAHDATLSLREISIPLLRDIAQLSPFGMGNPKPLLRIPQVLVSEMRRFGKEQHHLELVLECPHSGARVRAFDFFRAPEDLSFLPATGEVAAILAHIERDTFRGGVCLRLVDVVSP